MLDLFLAELRRFRTGAIIYFLASLLLLTLLNQLVDIPTAQRELHMVLLLLYVLSGLGFGLYQFGTYRQPSRWIWLQHRPLHRGRILAGIALASIALIALAMALPPLILLACQQQFTQRMVDARHYGGVAFLALSTVSGWLAGAYIMLHRSRWAFVVLALPILFNVHLASYGTVVAQALGCNAVLAFLVYTVFRPNRYSGDDALATIASALPLQLSFYIALAWGGSMLFQVGQMLAGVHPLAPDHIIPGGHVEAMRFSPREALLAGLAGVKDPRTAAWRAGLDLRSTATLGPRVRQYAVRDVVSSLGMSTFHDGENMWRFSHDRMLYRGVQHRSGASAGWYGAGGRGDLAPFDSQPAPLRDNLAHSFLVTAHDLYQLEDDGRRLRHMLHVDGAEQLGGGIAVLGARTALLTNRRVILLQESGGQTAPLATIALPVRFGDLERAEAARVADGTLVSFIGGNRLMDGVMEAPQVIYLVDAGGRVSEIGRRELAHDFPLLFEHKDWWASPLLHAAVKLPELLIDKGMVPDDGAGRFEPLLRPRPAPVWAAMVILALASGAGAAWWTRRARMAPRARAAWCLACVLLGCPALLSLMVLRPRAGEEPAAQPADLPAAA